MEFYGAESRAVSKEHAPAVKLLKYKREAFVFPHSFIGRNHGVFRGKSPNRPKLIEN
jgi:hypothetical protein